jgi:BirA family biotin operon repressor/biotin-[acetyl-CoA-carboxylase] ligase
MKNAASAGGRLEGLTLRNPALVGRNVVRLARCGSTNDEAFARLERDGDAAHGIAVFAEEQTAGRGRRGRSWLSRPGFGLMFSVGLRADAAPPPAALVAGAAAAVRAAIQAIAPIDVRIKWPNDLLVSGRKICGILVEARTSGGRAHVVIGIGINANEDPRAHLDPALAGIATSIAHESGRPVDREALARAALEELDARLPAILRGDFARIEREFAAGLGFAGEAVRVEAGAAAIIGEFVAFDARRGVALRTAGGRETIPAESITSLSRLRAP